MACLAALEAFFAKDDGGELRLFKRGTNWFEYCFNLRRNNTCCEDPARAAQIVYWLLCETFDEDLSVTSFLSGCNSEKMVSEVGPRPAFESAWSSTCVSICNAAGAVGLASAERSRRYAGEPKYDRMTECEYPPKAKPEPSKATAHGFDEADLAYYKDLFEDMGREATEVELYDLAQSNSEHSRHWFFSGRQVIDGVEKPSLFHLVKEPLRVAKSDSSIIAFSDNSSAIRGADGAHHPVLTAETHNFPTAVAPFPGAETGAGGRIRDVQATGRGARTCAGIAGYCVGSIFWGDEEASYPSHLAPPIRVLIEASDGASDYGNKFGEPLVLGFCRSFGGKDARNERCEWVKPVMFSAGVGWIADRNAKKGDPKPGMKVCKIGGPAYRIGMGGGTASSRVSSAENAGLDFDAVQRGDAQMCNRMNRVVQACASLPRNPIVSIHDQGCGGNGNVLKEIVAPEGAIYDLSKFTSGDDSMTALELWSAEYQESNAILIHPEDEETVRTIARRERCGFDVVGVVTGDGTVKAYDRREEKGGGVVVVDLPLAKVLGKLPPKVFESTTPEPPTTRVEDVALPPSFFFRAALTAVLKLPGVGSKRFLVHKADRSVTGLVARQQCVGPYQVAVSNVAVLARSMFHLDGVAVAVGEAPQLSALADAAVMARRCVAEMFTNLCWARVTKRQDVRLSGNWMWAAKLPGEGARMYRCCEALSKALVDVEVAIDGGKDSLSMAAPDAFGNVVKSPGTLTLTAYAACPDIRAVVTPELRGGRALIFVDLGEPKKSLGGTSYAQATGRWFAEATDCDPRIVAAAFDVVQQLVLDHRITAGHDKSDGGLVVTLLEMCFASDAGVDVEISDPFDEGPGLVLEGDPSLADLFPMTEAKVIGRSTVERTITLRGLMENVPVVELWEEWESTSFDLERLQRAPLCVDAEEESLASRKPVTYRVPFDLLPPPRDRSRVAIVRCEGSNGDAEMSAAFELAGLCPCDVAMTDLPTVSLDQFRGIAFVGGFSYADVCDSAKGWAAIVRFNLAAKFRAFRNRPDTFSLGVCNGCQLMALLGWLVPAEENKLPRFVHNTSRKFESRWVTVTVEPSPSVLLAGMEGAVLGVWVAHAEGRAYFPDPEIRDAILAQNLAPLRYADDDGRVNPNYPYCPNGSDRAIAGLCSADGRHLAIMPHPERCVLRWQWPWLADLPSFHQEDWSPWLRLFQNAANFCEQSTS
ncbi:hypothetical protein CTAYLR_005389 [Chrysophaeum taylorii]|uniref:phosphoribosylformylglycinamidine synthase n=1 Tax=Chrysophaeum taylorii TaxID=2483200 RepID=A0AAD7U7C6_9STRA|nr:hypothetical protein CTAYLR_005389 [Chrysophaeum taylorii]